MGYIYGTYNKDVNRFDSTHEPTVFKSVPDLQRHITLNFTQAVNIDLIEQTK